MSMNVFERAQRHAITVDKPAVNFFEGALLGNGGMGVVVTTRPDRVLLHFGHNSVWDIRVAENHAEEFGTFAEVLEKVKTIPADLDALEEDTWYRDYLKMTQENYRAEYARCRSECVTAATSGSRSSRRWIVIACGCARSTGTVARYAPRSSAFAFCPIPTLRRNFHGTK